MIQTIISINKLIIFSTIPMVHSFHHNQCCFHHNQVALPSHQKPHPLPGLSLPCGRPRRRRVSCWGVHGAFRCGWVARGWLDINLQLIVMFKVSKCQLNNIRWGLDDRNWWLHDRWCKWKLDSWSSCSELKANQEHRWHRSWAESQFLQVDKWSQELLLSIEPCLAVTDCASWWSWFMIAKWTFLDG